MMSFMLALQILIDEEERRCAHREFFTVDSRRWFQDTALHKNIKRVRRKRLGSDLRTTVLSASKASVATREGTIDIGSRATIGANTGLHPLPLVNVRAR